MADSYGFMTCKAVISVNQSDDTIKFEHIYPLSILPHGEYIIIGTDEENPCVRGDAPLRIMQGIVDYSENGFAVRVKNNNGKPEIVVYRPDRNNNKIQLKVGLIEDYLNNIPGLNYQKSLAFFAATVLIDDIGIRKFRKVTGRFGDKSWYILNQGIRKIKISKTNPFKLIQEEIEKFETIRLENYKDKM